MNDPLHQQEELVYTIVDSRYNAIYYTCYDYNDGIWLSVESDDMSEYFNYYCLRYSITNNAIGDSINIKNIVIAGYDPFQSAYDPVSKTLVFFEPGMNLNPKLICYDPTTQNVTTIILQLEEYNSNEFNSLYIQNIFIDPSGRLYIFLYARDLSNQSSRHLYICNSIKDTSMIRIYDCPSYIVSFFYYNSAMYAYINDRIYKLLF